MINAIRHAGILSGLMVAVFLRAPLSGLSEEPQVSPSSASQASSVLSPPDRGFISSEPGLTWEQGLLSGNGTIGASVLGRPLDEIVVLSHKRLFVPERPPLLPPREPNNRRFRSNTDRLATTTDASALTYRNEFTHAYPGSIQALEGVARVVATNGTTSTDGPALTVAGAAWAAHFFYDYWLYTGDRAFLAGHSLPFMEKAALFFEDYLTEGPDGRYVFSPTQSPENAPANTRSQVTFNATMDVAAAKELLANTIAVSRELGVNRDKVLVWERMPAKMPPYLLNEDGAVKEWLTPRLTDNYNHRHSSQLYALFDGLPEEIARDPKLQAAFKKLIEIKLDRHWSNWEKQGGFMSFGLVQLGQAAASLGEADLAYRCLVPLLNRYWLHNLASMHNAKKLFNMDISGGLPAVVIKMLAASEPGVVRLLPALPAAWPSGTIEGVLCRGQIEIRRLTWNGRTVSAVLESAKAQAVSLFAPAEIASIRIPKGGASVTALKDPRGRRLSLPAGREVGVEIEMK